MTTLRTIVESLGTAAAADEPTVLATVVKSDDHSAVGAHALLDGGEAMTVGPWDASALAAIVRHEQAARVAGRRGLLARCGASDVAFELVVPPPRLLLCG